MVGSCLDSDAYRVLGWLRIQFEGARGRSAIWSVLLDGARAYLVPGPPDLEEAHVKHLSTLGR